MPKQMKKIPILKRIHLVAAIEISFLLILFVYNRSLLSNLHFRDNEEGAVIHSSQEGDSDYKNVDTNETVPTLVSSTLQLDRVRNPITDLHAKENNETQWQLSDDWIHTCVADLSSVSDGDAQEWIIPHKIALADCIKFCRCYHRSLPDTTLNKMYFKRACPMTPVSSDNPKVQGKFNLSIIDEIHKIQSSYPNFTIPEADELVIHLRLGDIVETSSSTAEEMLIHGADPGYPTKNFLKSIKSIYELLDNVRSSQARRVSIIGGSHRKEFWKKSRVYSNCIYRAMQMSGYNVTLQIEGNHPDADFYYISHAKSLVVSGGGYSNIMAMLAERRGGKIIGRSFGVAW